MGTRDQDDDGVNRRRGASRRSVLRGIGGLGALGLAGIGSATSVNRAAQATNWDEYTKVVLDADTESPAMVDVAPDGQVFYIERGEFGGGLRTNAEVVTIDQSSAETESTVAFDMTVFAGQEDGLLGILLDSDFEETGWVYLYYSPPNREIADTEEELEYLNQAGQSDDVYGSVDEAPVEPYNRLSRFTYDDGSIDPESEVEVMRVHTQRDTCCHTGGDMHWGPDGERLYLTTGDDTNPFQSNGYTPIDERESRAYFDAQRSAANTNDLRGKILRIVPQEDGSYEIPGNNLFTGDEYADARENDEVRPEIYVMGCRNPYRAAMDEETGAFYWGDYGPDASEWDPQRGPPATVEYNRATEPGFYGWPYFVGPNVPYVDGQFEDADTEREFVFDSSGEAFDPQNPRNDSPHNDGLTDLPPTQEAMIYYTPVGWEQYLDAPEYAQEYLPDQSPFPALDGAAPNAGPVFRYHDDYDSEVSIPESYDGQLFMMEWNLGWIKTVSIDDDGNPTGISPFLPDSSFLRPMDMKTGPAGSLYLVEWGSSFGGPNEDSGVYRIDHDGLQTPAPVFANAEETVDPGTTVTVEATLTNESSTTIESGDVTLVSGADLEIGEGAGTTFDSLPPGESQSMAWEVTVPESVAGSDLTLTTRTMYTFQEKRVQETATRTLQVTGSDAAATVIEPGTTIRLGGDTTGWVGRAPSSIEGATNPTLPLEVGGTYTVEWENVDGAPHNFYVIDSDGNQIEGTGTELITEEGATASVQLTVSSDMAEYYCSVHPQSMRGDVSLPSDRGPGGTGNGTATEGGTETPATTEAEETETATETDAAETTQTTGPGFGIGSVAAALGVAALAEKLRRD